MTNAERQLARLRRSARGCRACPLWKLGTQTVFGEGPANARLVLIGEQPGDQEDLAGQPFVGPAGKLLDTALEHAGLDRDACYVTNAVKHFKWEPRGKRRIHKKPSDREVAICEEQWLEQEIALLEPDLIVLLGATAAQGVLGKAFRVTRDRGRVMTVAEDGRVVAATGRKVLATVHPSSILRSRTAEERTAALEAFVSDLRAAARFLRVAARGKSSRKKVAVAD